MDLDISVKDKELIIKVVEPPYGILVIAGNGDGNKALTCAIIISYTGILIEWSSANMYTNSSCEVSGNRNSGIIITIKADQISASDGFSLTGRVYG